MANLKSRVAALGERTIAGYVVDPDDLEKRFVVELRLDGWPLRLARATRLDSELANDGTGDGCYGFCFELEETVARDGGVVEVALANGAESLAPPLTLGAVGRREATEGAAHWVSGLRFSGWLGTPAAERAPLVRALIDGETVAEARADRWTAQFEGGAAAPARAVEMDLPVRFADGRARRVRLIDENGRDLSGSPCAFIAFADGLERLLTERAELKSERARGALYDALFPRAHPLHDFAGWRRRFPLEPPVLTRRFKVAVALLGAGNVDGAVGSLQRQQGCEWVGAALGGDSMFDIPTGELQEFLGADARDADFIVFAPADAVFEPSALARLATAFERAPEAKIAYADATFVSVSGQEWPLAFPAFDYERQLEQGYAAYCFAVQRRYLAEVDLQQARDVFSLLLSALPANRPAQAGIVVHAPGFAVRLPEFDLDAGAERLAAATAAHLQARNVKADVTAAFSGRLPAVKVLRAYKSQRICAVVATRGEPDKVTSFLRALSASIGRERVEMIVVDFGGGEGFDDLVSEGVRIAHMSGPHRPERCYLMASSIATSELMLFATPDMVPLRAGWLEAMLSRLAEPDVAAVAPTLLWPSGVVQQSGLAVGPDFSVGRAFRDVGDGDLGYGEALATAREAMAVGSEGMLVRRGVFNDFGGFDLARYPTRFAAPDFCLRLRAMGYRVILDPRAKFTVERLAEAPRETDADLGDRARRELEMFRGVWAEALAADPLYNPQLALAGAPFSALAWPPRPLDPRLPRIAPGRAWPAGA